MEYDVPVINSGDELAPNQKSWQILINTNQRVDSLTEEENQKIVADIKKLTNIMFGKRQILKLLQADLNVYSKELEGPENNEDMKFPLFKDGKQQFKDEIEIVSITIDCPPEPEYGNKMKCWHIHPRIDVKFFNNNILLDYKATIYIIKQLWKKIRNSDEGLLVRPKLVADYINKQHNYARGKKKSKRLAGDN